MVGEVRYEYKLEEFRYWYYWRYAQGNAFLPVPSNKSGFDGFTGPLLQNRAGKEWILYGVVSKPLDVEEAKETLRGAVPDLDVYLDKGQIEIIPYAHWYVKEGVFDSDRVLNEWVEKLNKALVAMMG